MPKYTVTVPFACYVTVADVEAEDQDTAIDIALEDAYLDSFAGNGGHNKLIGVRGERLSVEAGYPIETPPFEIFAEQTDDED